MVYQIRIKGALDETWTNWLGDVAICREAGPDGLITTLTVDLADQAALFGILDHVRDLNLLLVSVDSQADRSIDPS